MEGRILGNRYLLATAIGAGGMGTVYRATDLRTGGAVAVKLLHPLLAATPGYASRLRREAQLAASLTSPRVVRVIDLNEDEGTPFLVMEFVPGPTLEELIEEQGAVPEAEALRIALEVARALEAAHAAGIVHRDLKPQNVKLADGQVKVLDFGIARGDVGGGPTMTGDYLGTPEYSAPELLEGRGDARTDIYALGVMLFRLIEGYLPFTGPTPLAVLNQQVTRPLPPLTRAGPAGVAVVARCTEKRPDDRYQTATALSSALQAAIASRGDVAAASPVAVADPAPARASAAGASLPPDERTPTAPLDAGLFSPPQPAVRRIAGIDRRLLAGAGGVLLVAVVAVALLVIRPWEGDANAGAGDAGTVDAGIGGQAVRAAPGDWLPAGSAQTDGGGAWRFKRTLPLDLIGRGFVRTKVTAGICAQGVDEVIAFEGTVEPDKTGQDLWEVILLPGEQARANPQTRTSGAAFLQRQASGRTRVEISLDNLPPRRTLIVCFRRQ